MAERKLEVCVDTVLSAVEAVKGGADRLELCAALSEGGLTPTTGLLLAVKKHISRPIDVFCMVRPRGGPMVYSEEEREIILHDAQTLIKAGADGLVFGALTSCNTIDINLCKVFREKACDIPCTFHRAFDLLQDPVSQLETVIELGYQRILTSGRRATALEGCTTLTQLVKGARGRIKIMAGAGVKSSNVANIISQTGVAECHASARVTRVFGSEGQNDARMGAGSDNILLVTCPQEVKAIKQAMAAG
ncbi:hypothetical protein Pcinc_012503 [Petrolisthes cinctipes]|uniref:Copper homeostasis protein cutC homolog n=1 Tax=Petrolisthes cinctipes TaxID=88211 RepID=A0AAE1G1P2_PETCI|nr:hypothetical protein Pcinc_012503 [Petrolisthes cinctipes]